MELACCLDRMSVKAVVKSAPREANKEADSLANGHTEQFDPNLRVHIDPAQLHCDIHPHALLMGRQAEQALSAKHEGPNPLKELDRRSVESESTSFVLRTRDQRARFLSNTTASR